MERALAAGIAVTAVLAVVFGPVIANRRFRSTRTPTAAEQERVDALRAWAELDIDRVYVIDTVGEASVDVAVRGPPSWRTLFVTDYAIEELNDGVAAALFAAEAGRTETYYGLVRALAIGAVLGLLGLTFALVIPFGPGFASIIVVGLVAFWIGRELQFRADEIAAKRVGHDELADAFERIADLRGVEPERGGWRTIFEIQPPLGDRIDRLRAANSGSE